MELYVWKSDYGLPSFDVECIQILLYVKIAKIPIEIKFERNPYLQFKGKYPIFKHGDVILADLPRIIDYLRERGYGLDFGLSCKSCSESYAFSNMMQLRMKPIVEYVCWADQKNYDEFFAPWFIKTMPLPFNYIYPKQCRKYAKALIESLYPRVSGLDSIQTYLKNSAIDCFSTLATRLGQRDYFYGGSPTSLDVCVYSYLAPLVKIPFPSKAIPSLLHTWPELIEYVRRIEVQFFPELPAREQVYSQHEFLKGVNTEDEFATAPITTKLLAFGFVAAAMLGYAVSKNILSIDSFKNVLPIATE